VLLIRDHGRLDSNCDRNGLNFEVTLLVSVMTVLQVREITQLLITDPEQMLADFT
jgi:hypothetical protein